MAPDVVTGAVVGCCSANGPAVGIADGAKTAGTVDLAKAEQKSHAMDVVSTVVPGTPLSNSVPLA